MAIFIIIFIVIRLTTAFPHASRLHEDRVEGRRCVNAFLRMQERARDVGGFYVLLSGERNIDIIFI